MTDDTSPWAHAVAVTRPALLLASPDFLDEIAEGLREAGVRDAVAWHDSGPVFNWMARLLVLQGISDQAAFSFDAANGGISYDAIATALDRSPSCPRLRSYWTFNACGYRKGAASCAEPRHRRRCPMPRHSLRKGVLNQASYSLFLYTTVGLHHVPSKQHSWLKYRQRASPEQPLGAIESFPIDTRRCEPRYSVQTRHGRF